MKDAYNWGILGPGKIAHKFAEGLQSVPRARLQAVASRDQKRAREFADQHQATKAYGTYEELANDPDIDIIYVATPHAFHMDQTLMCLERGKAVLCEKPLAINSQQVKRMIDGAKQHQCFLMEALWSRFLPHIIKAKELALSGSIGNILGVKADFGFQGAYDPQSRLFNPQLGGGALLDIGIYPLFFARLLFGAPKQVKAEVISAPTGVDMEGTVKLEFPQGTFANLHFTFAKMTPIVAEITGEEGSIRLNSRWYQPGDLILETKEGTQNIEIPQEGNGYNYQAVEVMNCLDQNLIQSPLWSHNDSWELMQLMDEIRRQGAIVYPMD